MSATRSDIVPLPSDYVPANGEKFWIVVVKDNWSRILTGHDFTNREATAAITSIMSEIRKEFGGEFDPLRARLIPNAEKPTEIHIEIQATGTPAVAFLIGLGISVVGLALLAVTVDRTYKIVDKAPVAAGLGIGGFFLIAFAGLMLVRKFIGAAAGGTGA
jgi:hypothetical protein